MTQGRLPSNIKDAGEIKWFGTVDRKDKRVDGEISSSAPAWINIRRIQMLREDIEDAERNLESPTMFHDAETFNRMKANTEAKKDRYREILGSRPKLTSKQTDTLQILYKDVREKISDSLFSRTDMYKGLADPHEELRRQKEPNINLPLENEGIKELVGGMNVRIDKKGRINRDDAIKVFRITGEYLGEDTNVERLRRDVATGTYKSPISFEELIKL